MTTLNDLTTSQIQSIIEIKEQIEALQSQIDSIAGGGEVSSPVQVEAATPAKRKYHITAAHKRKLVKALARARKARWAKYRGEGKAKADKPAKRRKMSAAVKAKIAAAARARWAKVKLEGKKAL
jgi:hypothetical protein